MQAGDRWAPKDSSAAMHLSVGDAQRVTRQVLGAPIDVVSWAQALGRIRTWAQQHESRIVCVCNVHSVVTAESKPLFASAVASADMAVPDGAPVAWALRRLGHRAQRRISGPDLMWRYCAEAATRGERMYLYGNTQATLDTLERRLNDAFPGLVIAGKRAPPFRTLSPEEDSADVTAINSSGAQVVWVSLGCPKQELWMVDHAGRVKAVMVGVGAAFDFLAGTVPRAPLWMQRCGLEWLYRLAREPRRLGRRYLTTNMRFVIAALWQILRRVA